MTEPKEELAALDAATRRYRTTERAHEQAREEMIKAVVSALKAEIAPTVVVDRSPFTAAYVRKLAREADIPAARPGIKPKPRGVAPK